MERNPGKYKAKPAPDFVTSTAAVLLPGNNSNEKRETTLDTC